MMSDVEDASVGLDDLRKKRLAYYNTPTESPSNDPPSSSNRHLQDGHTGIHGRKREMSATMVGDIPMETNNGTLNRADLHMPTRATVSPTAITAAPMHQRFDMPEHHLSSKPVKPDSIFQDENSFGAGSSLKVKKTYQEVNLSHSNVNFNTEHMSSFYNPSSVKEYTQHQPIAQSFQTTLTSTSSVKPPKVDDFECSEAVVERLIRATKEELLGNKSTDDIWSKIINETLSVSMSSCASNLHENKTEQTIENGTHQDRDISVENKPSNLTRHEFSGTYSNGAAQMSSSDSKFDRTEREVRNFHDMKHDQQHFPSESFVAKAPEPSQFEPTVLHKYGSNATHQTVPAQKSLTSAKVEDIFTSQQVLRIHSNNATGVQDSQDVEMAQDATATQQSQNFSELGLETHRPELDRTESVEADDINLGDTVTKELRTVLGEDKFQLFLNKSKRDIDDLHENSSENSMSARKDKTPRLIKDKPAKTDQGASKSNAKSEEKSPQHKQRDDKVNEKYYKNNKGNISKEASDKHNVRDSKTRLNSVSSDHNVKTVKDEPSLKTPDENGMRTYKTRQNSLSSDNHSEKSLDRTNDKTTESVPAVPSLELAESPRPKLNRPKHEPPHIYNKETRESLRDDTSERRGSSDSWLRHSQADYEQKTVQRNVAFSSDEIYSQAYGSPYSEIPASMSTHYQQGNVSNMGQYVGASHHGEQFNVHMSTSPGNAQQMAQLRHQQGVQRPGLHYEDPAAVQQHHYSAFIERQPSYTSDREAYMKPHPPEYSYHQSPTHMSHSHSTPEFLASSASASHYTGAQPVHVPHPPSRPSSATQSTCTSPGFTQHTVPTAYTSSSSYGDSNYPGGASGQVLQNQAKIVPPHPSTSPSGVSSQVLQNQTKIAQPAHSLSTSLSKTSTSMNIPLTSQTQGPVSMAMHATSAITMATHVTSTKITESPASMAMHAMSTTSAGVPVSMSVHVPSTKLTDVPISMATESVSTQSESAPTKWQEAPVAMQAMTTHVPSPAMSTEIPVSVLHMTPSSAKSSTNDIDPHPISEKSAASATAHDAVRSSMSTKSPRDVPRRRSSPRNIQPPVKAVEKLWEKEDSPRLEDSDTLVEDQLGTVVEESMFTSVSQINNEEKLVPHPPTRGKEACRPSPRWHHKADLPTRKAHDSKRHIDGIRQHHEQKRHENEEKVSEDVLVERQRRYAKASLDRYFTSLENVYMDSADDNIARDEHPDNTASSLHQLEESISNDHSNADTKTPKLAPIPQADDLELESLTSERYTARNEGEDMEKFISAEDDINNVLDELNNARRNNNETEAQRLDFDNGNYGVEKHHEGDRKEKVINGFNPVVNGFINFDETHDREKEMKSFPNRLVLSQDFSDEEAMDRVNDSITNVGKATIKTDKSMKTRDGQCLRNSVTDDTSDIISDVMSGKPSANASAAHKQGNSKNSKKRGKILIVCPHCEGLNKDYMSWCTHCNEMIIGVKPMLVSKNREGKIRTEPLVEKDELSSKMAGIHIDDSINTFRDGELNSHHHDEVNVHYAYEEVTDKALTLNLDAIKSSDKDEYDLNSNKKVSPNKSDSKDSGRPSSGDPDNDIQTQKIEEEVVNDICASISDPVVKGYVKSHFSKTKQSSQESGISGIGGNATLDTVQEQYQAERASFDDDNGRFFEDLGVVEDSFDTDAVHRRNDNDFEFREERTAQPYGGVESKIEMYNKINLPVDGNTKGKSNKKRPKTPEKNVTVPKGFKTNKNNDKSRKQRDKSMEFVSPPLPSFSENTPVSHNELALNIPSHSLDYSTDVSQFVSQNFENINDTQNGATNNTGESSGAVGAETCEKQLTKAERRQIRRRKRGHGAIDVEVFGYEETRDARNSSRANRMVPLLNLAGNSSDDDSVNDSVSSDIVPIVKQDVKLEVKAVLNAQAEVRSNLDSYEHTLDTFGPKHSSVHSDVKPVLNTESKQKYGAYYEPKPSSSDTDSKPVRYQEAKTVVKPEVQPKLESFASKPDRVNSNIKPAVKPQQEVKRPLNSNAPQTSSVNRDVRSLFKQEINHQQETFEPKASVSAWEPSLVQGEPDARQSSWLQSEVNQKPAKIEREQTKVNQATVKEPSGKSPWQQSTNVSQNKQMNVQTVTMTGAGAAMNVDPVLNNMHSSDLQLPQASGDATRNTRSSQITIEEATQKSPTTPTTEDWRKLFDSLPDDQPEDDKEEAIEAIDEYDDTQPFLMQVLNQSKPTKAKKRPKSARSGKAQAPVAGKSKVSQSIAEPESLRAGKVPVKSKVRQSLEEGSYKRKWARSSIAWSSYNANELSTNSSLRSSGDFSRPRPGSAPKSRSLQASVGLDVSASVDQATRTLGKRPVSADVNKRLLGSSGDAYPSRNRPASAPKARSTQPGTSASFSVTLNEHGAAGGSEEMVLNFPATYSTNDGGNTRKRKMKTKQRDVSLSLDLAQITETVEHRLPQPSIIYRLQEHMALPKYTYDKYLEMTPRIEAGTVSRWQCLPDEILLHVFAYLDQTSLVNVARVCQQYYRVAMDETLWKYITIKKLDMDDECLAEIARRHPVSLALIQCYGDRVTSRGLRDLFKDCASTLKELNIARCSRGALTGDSLLLHAAMKCKDLTHIDMSWSNPTDSGIMAISNCSHRLESLCINGCQAVSNDGLETVIKKHGTSLRVLEMFGCFNLSPRGLRALGNNCVNLVTLNLGQCYKLTDNCVSQLSTSLGQVETLDLRGLKQVKDNCIRRVVKNCPRLKHLSLANCPNITDVSVLEISTYLTDIRSIDVCGCKNVTDNSIRALVNSCTNLRSIDISSTGCTHRSVSMIANFCGQRLENLKINFLLDVTEQSLIKLAKHCLKLTSVHMYGCTGIRNQLDKIKEANPTFSIEM